MPMTHQLHPNLRSYLHLIIAMFIGAAGLIIIESPIFEHWQLNAPVLMNMAYLLTSALLLIYAGVTFAVSLYDLVTNPMPQGHDKQYSNALLALVMLFSLTAGWFALNSFTLTRFS